MDPTVLRSALMTRVRELADLVGSEVVTDNELKGYVDQSVAGLYDLLVKHSPPDFFVSTSSFFATAGTTLYDLPADFYILTSVMDREGQEWRKARKFQNERRDEIMNLRATGLYTTYYYRLRGRQTATGGAGVQTPTAQIEIFPAPPAGHQFSIEYLPTVSRAENGGDVKYYGVNGWEDWAVYDAVIKCLLKQRMDAGDWAAQRAMVQQRIEQLAGSRDAAEPEYQADVRRDFDHRGDRSLPRWWT